MKNLEDLWKSYPTSEPPTAALLAEARRRAGARRRKLVRRPLFAGVAAAALAGTFVVGDHVGGDHRGPGAAAPALRVSAFQADLHPATSCAQLLDSYRSRSLADVSAYGWKGWGPINGPLASQDLRGLDAGATPAPAPAMDAVGNSATGTNVQETGVDEPDDVKTDGSLIVRVRNATLSVYDASGTTIRRTARLALPHLADAEILLADDTVVAIGRDTAARPARSGPTSRVETISVADPSRPTVASDVAYSGTVTSVRQHGPVARLVINAGPPALHFVFPQQGKRTAKQALAHNRAVVRRSTLTDWLPTYDDGSGRRPLLECDKVAIPPAGLPLGTVGIVGFDAAAPAAFDAIGVAGQTDIAYESASHLYLTSTPSAAGYVLPLVVHAAPVMGDVAQPCCGIAQGAQTTIFQFDLDGPRAVHVATGKVDGSIADRWSMDEAGGVLRVATTQEDRRISGGEGTVIPSSSVVTLRADGTRLVEVGRLGGLGVNETLTAARWFDDVAILSTARRTDPLLSIDLSDPARPRLLGALHIPGYTTYFHPIGHSLLIGVGQKVAFDSGGERERAQVALFDVSDLAHARRLDVKPMPQSTWPVAGDDPRAFTWLPDRATALTAFTTGRAMVLGIYHLTGTALTEQLRTLPASGSDSADVRTFELADGRVVLMVGNTMTFLGL
jgi:hypothetical protein